MVQEIKFQKYRQRSVGYHWEQTSNHLYKYNAYVEARYKNVVGLCKKHVEPTKKINVLDLGCGDGVLSYLLYKEGYKVCGIDTDELAIKYAQEKHHTLNTNVKFMVGSAYQTGLDANFFDIIVCSDVIEHVTYPNKLIAECKRIAKDEAVYLYTTPIRFTYEPLDKMHVQEFYREEFFQLLKAFFDKIDIEISHPYIWYEIYNKRMRFRVLVNILSKLGYNPFLKNKGYRLFNMQYAVCRD